MTVLSKIFFVKYKDLKINLVRPKYNFIFKGKLLIIHNS